MTTEPTTTGRDPILDLQQRAQAAGLVNVIAPAPVRLGTLNAEVRLLRLDPKLPRSA